MALPRTCARVGVQRERGDRAPGLGAEDHVLTARPRSNQIEFDATGPVTRKNTASATKSSGATVEGAWRGRSRVGRGGQSRFSAS